VAVANYRKASNAFVQIAFHELEFTNPIELRLARGEKSRDEAEENTDHLRQAIENGIIEAATAGFEPAFLKRRLFEPSMGKTIFRTDTVSSAHWSHRSDGVQRILDLR
jgi:hypothetical protein